MNNEQFIVQRKRKIEYEQFTCRIEVELLKEIKEIVLNNNLKSVNSFINDALKYAIDNMKITD